MYSCEKSTTIHETCAYWTNVYAGRLLAYRFVRKSNKQFSRRQHIIDGQMYERTWYIYIYIYIYIQDVIFLLLKERLKVLLLTEVGLLLSSYYMPL